MISDRIQITIKKLLNEKKNMTQIMIDSYPSVEEETKCSSLRNFTASILLPEPL